MTGELDALAAITVYIAELKHWLDSHDDTPQPSTLKEMVQGRWSLSNNAGLLEFSSDGFRWYRDAHDEKSDCYLGSWSVLPGVKTAMGFILDREQDSTRCFSVVLRYTTDRMAGVDHRVDRAGLMFIEQAGSPDQVLVYNHRTAQHLLGTRIP